MRVNHVRIITARETHDLRRRVLRAGDADADLAWFGDDDTSTTHLGVVDADGNIIAVSTWLDRDCPSLIGAVARQLRGMATDPAHRGAGIGSMLLAEGVRIASDNGADVLWANARILAVAFYERAGWVASGPPFTTEETGLPHRLVTRSPADTLSGGTARAV